MRHNLLLIFFAFFIQQIFGQTYVNVTYGKVNEELHQLASITDVDILAINIHGNLKGKKIALIENIVNSDGNVISNEVLTSYSTINTDSIVINVMSRPITKDSTKLDIRSSNLFYHTAIHVLPTNDNHILMETIFDDIPTHNIPIFAYTSGITEKFSVDGNIVEGIDYCGLRDSNTSPILWKEKFKIENFIYYSVQFNSSLNPHLND